MRQSSTAAPAVGRWSAPGTLALQNLIGGRGAVAHLHVAACAGEQRLGSAKGPATGRLATDRSLLGTVVRRIPLCF